MMPVNEAIPVVPFALNHDVLLSVLSVSPPKTATSIMETCRFLYHEGAKIILSQEPISLYGSEQAILALLRFVQAEDLSRCSYVRSLFIFGMIPISENVAKILMDIIPRMSNLRVLMVRGRQMLELYPYLVPAFASLRSVKNLMMNEAGAQCCELLRTFQSELVSATIIFAPTSRNNTHSSPAFSHPLHLLRRSASTLQKLTCRSWCDTHRDTPTTTTSDSQIVYPEVRDLVLDRKCAVELYLPPFIQALPNIIHLKVEGDVSALEEALLLDLFGNQEPQMSVMRQSTPNSPVWKHIQTYTGAVSELHALGISFHIPRLYLENLASIRSPPEVLMEVLTHVRPIHLTITYKNQPFGVLSLDRHFLAALHSDGTLRLQSLGLVISMMAANVDGAFDVGKFWTSVETALTRLQLRDLCIIMVDLSLPETVCTAHPSPDGGEQDIHTHEHADGTAPHNPVDSADPASAHPDCPQCSEAKHRKPRTLAERTLEDFDVDAFVDRLATSIPTLQNALVSIARPSRWGGGMRTKGLGKHDNLMAEMRVKVPDEKGDEMIRKSLTMGFADEN